MATDMETEQTRDTEDPPGRDPAQPSRHLPIGSYTDDPAANARHSADIADMMADRSRGSADGAAASAATALNALRLAQVAADRAAAPADRSPNRTSYERVTAEKALSMVGIRVSNSG